jgi:hypothetical protein
MLRKKSLLLGIAILAIIIGLIGLFTFELRPQQYADRDNYRTDNFEKDPWSVSFNQEYKEARQNHASWVKDPITLALRVAGYPNIDGADPDEIHIYYKTHTKVTAIIRNYGPMGDSVKSEETRVDLIFKENEWEIEWSGSRWRCMRDAPPSLEWIDSLLPGWTNSLCS